MIALSDVPGLVFRLLTSSLINCTNTSINDVPHSKEFFHSLREHPFYLIAVCLCFVLCACTITIGFIHVLFITYYTSESERRFFMFYLASTAPMVSLFSLIAMCMPRVWLLCHLLAFLVFSIGLWIVICLLMHIFQGHNSLVSRMSERLQHIELATPPFCCCCVFPCLPKVSLQGKRIRICEWMVLQTPFVRLIATFAALVIYFEYQEDSGMYLKILDIITLPSLLAGIYGMHILVTTVSRLDEVISYRYVVIFRLLDLFFMVFGLQQPVFDLVARSEPSTRREIRIMRWLWKITQ
ncbi:hypothetical protein WR25_19291 [Diploscapter pachys]|uniref:Uncharacterized protein n=1 Tax=Diploscapter pachys TaxID=2018661 RepID=A0A2A2JUW7_9BILA|nr:hypothetical protein WR25_19291 [Diploscapter pachys]